MNKFALTSLFLFSLSVLSVQAAVLRGIEQDSKTLHSFKVTKKKYFDETIITVTVPRAMEGEVFQSLRYSIDDRTRITTNGTELQFVMNPAQFEKAIAYVDYTDPDHDPENTGGLTVYKLDLSSLVAVEQPEKPADVEQDGARQPATAVDSKSEGSEKPKQVSEGRPQ
jgi:hypothetical protein